MNSWTKRLIKERSADLALGENFVGGTFFQGSGTARGQILIGVAANIRRDGGALDPVLMQAARTAQGQAHAAAADEHNMPNGSYAAQISQANGVLAFTEQRVIVFGFKRGTFKTKIEDPVASFGREHVTSWSLAPGKLVGKINLGFSDGSDISFEVPRGGGPDWLAETLGIPLAE